MPDVERTVMDALGSLLRRREEPIEVTTSSDIFDDLMLDSLEVAEFSAILEDELGSDPYTEGIVPQTVAEVIAFYG